MAELVWDVLGERYFEAGLDRGVLYTTAFGGVAWPGLISVNEQSTGGTATPDYFDGVKFRNDPSPEDFEATIQAFSAPKEFSRCDGTWESSNGLFITQQRRISFGLSYRTKQGNDLLSTDRGHKIHIVYNALAEPSARAYNTIDASPRPLNLSWKITSRPIKIENYKHSAHLVIDSVMAGPSRMTALENILYGTSLDAPRLPEPQELLDLFA